MLTNKDPCEEAVSIVTTILRFIDVGDSEHVQLRTSATASRIDGEQDGPGDNTADEHQGRDQLQEAQQQICVHRVVLEDVGVGQFVHRGDPVPKTSGTVRGTLPGLQATNVGTRHIHSAVATAQNDEEKDHDHEDDQGRDQGGHERGCRAGCC